MSTKKQNSARAVDAVSDQPLGDFESLDLAKELRQAVREAGYKRPTPIQQAAIPLVLSGSDLIGCAQTGTGKTAAFALPILNRLLMDGRGKSNDLIRTLVLAPTRELAAQIGASFESYAKKTRLRTMVVFGGVKKGPQVNALRRPPAILVATPGRLLDLLSDRALSLSEVEYAVLDEADRMLDMGFIHDVRRILSTLPKQRQTLLFSATMPREVEKLAAQFLDCPQRIAVDPVSSTVEPIEQSVHFVEKREKTGLLIETLRSSSQALVFTRTKHGANKVVRQLAKAGISAAAIHGNKSQSARETALAAFKSGRTRIVVATDLASRGLDVKELPLVVNYDLPNEPEVYVHRIGRTGRAGSVGTAVSFCSREELPYLGSIEKLTRRRLDRIGSEPKPLTGSESRAESRASAARPATTRPARPRRRSDRPYGNRSQQAGEGNAPPRRRRRAKPAGGRPSNGPPRSRRGGKGSGARPGVER